MTFRDRLLLSIAQKGPLCVGLDSRYDRIPNASSSIVDTVFSFNAKIVDATCDIAAAYKMNISFYAGFGQEGLEALRKTNAYIKTNYPDIPLLADGKRSEMGESVRMVKQELFDWLLFDCVMVTPWFGFDTARDYLDDPRHGVCVYVHDSNPSAGEFQDLELRDGRKVYEVVAERVAKEWNVNGNVWVEGGATYPEQLRRIRAIVGEDMPMLVAGIGPQGGSVESLRGLFGTNRNRLLVNSSRGIIFAGIGNDDYIGEARKAAMKIRESILHLGE